MSNETIKYCECGCGMEVNPGNRYIHGHNWLGKKHSEETKKKMSKPRSEIGKQNMSDAQKGKHVGKKNRMYGVHMFGKENPHWKGGHKLAIARSHAKRNAFGFIPLNECREDNWVGHHLDINYVLYIPEKLHRSVFHSVTADRNMDIINDVVYDWFVEEYLQEGVING